eukprot:3199507-Pyramimonas_sp.AAC.1
MWTLWGHEACEKCVDLAARCSQSSAPKEARRFSSLPGQETCDEVPRIQDLCAVLPRPPKSQVEIPMWQRSVGRVCWLGDAVLPYVDPAEFGRRS